MTRPLQNSRTFPTDRARAFTLPTGRDRERRRLVRSLDLKLWRWDDAANQAGKGRRLQRELCSRRFTQRSSGQNWSGATTTKTTTTIRLWTKQLVELISPQFGPASRRLSPSSRPPALALPEEEEEEEEEVKLMTILSLCQNDELRTSPNEKRESSCNTSRWAVTDTTCARRDIRVLLTTTTTSQPTAAASRTS